MARYGKVVPLVSVLGLVVLAWWLIVERAEGRLSPPVDSTAGQPTAQHSQILSASDCESLNTKAKDYFEAWLRFEYAAATPKARRDAARALSEAKESFLKDWENRSRKGDPLASVVDIRAVFDCVFRYPPHSASGGLELCEGTDRMPGYWLMAPELYDANKAYRSVVLVPGRDVAKNEWSQARVHYEATWGTSSLVDQTIVLLPALDTALHLDVEPDLAQPGAFEGENSRIRAVLGPVGQVQRDFNLDRERVILDAGDGASAFALRLASYFPHRFAGLILRHPIDVTQEVRLGSLRGVAVLLLSSDQTEAACEAIAAKLNVMVPGSCKVIRGAGAYPFSECQAEIDAWAATVRRQRSPSRLVIEPNHDAFNDAFWVKLGVTESLVGLPEEMRPRLAIEADKENNVITVESRGVYDFMLLLNDDLIDLGKEFTVSVNGTLLKEERSRSLSFMVDGVQQQFDPTWIYTTSFATTVPKGEPR